MRKYLLIIGLGLLLNIAVYSQCTTEPGYVCISQSTADKIQIMKGDYDKAQILIADLQQKIKDSDLSSGIKDSLIAKFTKLADADTQIEAKQQEMLALLRDEIKDYMDEVAHLKKQLGQGKGKTEKILGVLKIIYYLGATVAVVIGL